MTIKASQCRALFAISHLHLVEERQKKLSDGTGYLLLCAVTRFRYNSSLGISHISSVEESNSICKFKYISCHRTWKTWKKGNFLIKSGKTLKSQGKSWKSIEVREKSGNIFVLFVCFSGMHKIGSSGQISRGYCLC